LSSSPAAAFVNAAPASQTPARGSQAVLYGAVILLSAILLFQVESILGKYILPWFGGATGVWATCLLFFQLLLLAGYSYAHWLTSRLAPAAQARTHSLLLALSVAVLGALALFWPTPITPGASWKPESDSFPVWMILRVLLVSIGLPFLLLSTTASLLQRWYTYTHPGSSPYRFYALSNLGSLVGLLSYPLVLEPILRLRVQAWAWSGAYLLYVAGGILCALGMSRAMGNKPVTAPTAANSDTSAPPTFRQKALWVTLAGLASLMLLATTHFICQDVAVVPLLWVLPLAVYLVTFIICFDSERWYKPGAFHFLLALAGVTLMLIYDAWLGIVAHILSFLAIMFVACMFCHGELYRRRPGAHHLTTFYLMVSLGGVLGGAFVDLLSPIIFRGYWELHVGLFACLALMVGMAILDEKSWVYRATLWAPLAIVLLAFWLARVLPSLDPDNPPVVPQLADTLVTILIATVALIAGALALMRVPVGGKPLLPPEVAFRMVLICALAATGAVMVMQVSFKYRESAWSNRNFYGVLYVVKHVANNPVFNGYKLLHGRTIHGMQFSQPMLRHIPTTYYGPASGVGLTLQFLPRRDNPDPTQRTLRIGAIGLGVGTLAAYTQPGDSIHFYEINPADIRLARGDYGYFSFLKDSAGPVEVSEGDARISLERELQRGQLGKYDVLVIDAFSSDSIPVHLLTKEAIELYRQHLRGPDSVLAFHISNRALDIAPVLARLADEFHLHAVEVKVPIVAIVGDSDWVLMSADSQVLKTPRIAAAAQPLGPRRVRLWTDDYSNLIQILRTE